MEQTNDNQPESAIDRARKKEIAPKKVIDWSGLGKDVLNFLLKLIIIFLIGSRVVFACKVAQANILPTDSECMPYTPSMPSLSGEKEESPKYDNNTPEANIDVSYIYNKDQGGYIAYATRIAFEINEASRKYYLLDKIRNIEYNPNVNPMVKYLCVVITNIFVFYYGVTNSLFNFMNSNLNESAIILIGPYLLKYLSIVIYPISIIVSIIFCLLNLGWLMKSNQNNNKEYKHKSTTEPIWRPCDPLSSIYNFFGTIIYLYIGLFLAIIISMSPIPAIIGVICILTPLFMKAKIIDPDDIEKEPKNLKDYPIYGFGSSIKGLIESKLDVFMMLFCIFTTYATYQNSTDIKFPIFVGLASLWFLYNTLKSKAPPQMATDILTTYERNEKKCPERKLSKEELAAIARDEEEAAEQAKEADKNSYISQIIAFWTWFPKMIYKTLFDPDQPSSKEGEPQPEPPAPVEEAAVAPVVDTASTPAPAPAPEPPPESEPRQVSTPAEQTGGRKDDLLRRINNLKRSLKRRSK